MNLCVNFLFCTILFISPLSPSFMQARAQDMFNTEEELTHYLLPEDHPAYKPLTQLFEKVDRKIFDHPAYMIAHGFMFFNHYAENLMVCTHPELSAYVVKKFTNIVPSSEQIACYVRRVCASRRTMVYIKNHHLQNIVVPEKYLFKLPKQFSEKGEPTYLLVADKIDLCNKSETKKRYYSIKKEALDELCRFVAKFRGLDSSIGNLPFTKSNKIAFIDLDKWRDYRTDEFLSQVKHTLNPRNKRYVERFEAEHLN